MIQLLFRSFYIKGVENVAQGHPSFFTSALTSEQPGGGEQMIHLKTQRHMHHALKMALRICARKNFSKFKRLR